MPVLYVGKRRRRKQSFVQGPRLSHLEDPKPPRPSGITWKVLVVISSSGARGQRFGKHRVCRAGGGGAAGAPGPPEAAGRLRASTQGRASVAARSVKTRRQQRGVRAAGGAGAAVRLHDVPAASPLPRPLRRFWADAPWDAVSSPTGGRVASPLLRRPAAGTIPLLQGPGLGSTRPPASPARHTPQGPGAQVHGDPTATGQGREGPGTAGARGGWDPGSRTRRGRGSHGGTTPSGPGEGPHRAHLTLRPGAHTGCHRVLARAGGSPLPAWPGTHGERRGAGAIPGLCRLGTGVLGHRRVHGTPPCSSHVMSEKRGPKPVNK